VCLEPVGCLTNARWSSSFPFLPSSVGDGIVPIVEEAEGGGTGRGLGGG
jgi:hypothetical protein